MPTIEINALTSEVTNLVIEIRLNRLARTCPEAILFAATTLDAVASVDWPASKLETKARETKIDATATVAAARTIGGTETCLVPIGEDVADRTVETSFWLDAEDPASTVLNEAVFRIKEATAELTAEKTRAPTMKVAVKFAEDVCDAALVVFIDFCSEAMAEDWPVKDRIKLPTVDCDAWLLTEAEADLRSCLTMDASAEAADCKIFNAALRDEIVAVLPCPAVLVSLMDFEVVAPTPAEPSSTACVTRLMKAIAVAETAFTLTTEAIRFPATVTAACRVLKVAFKKDTEAADESVAILFTETIFESVAPEAEEPEKIRDNISKTEAIGLEETALVEEMRAAFAATAAQEAWKVLSATFLVETVATATALTILAMNVSFTARAETLSAATKDRAPVFDTEAAGEEDAVLLKIAVAIFEARAVETAAKIRDAPLSGTIDAVCACEADFVDDTFLTKDANAAEVPSNNFRRAEKNATNTALADIAIFETTAFFSAAAAVAVEAAKERIRTLIELIEPTADAFPERVVAIDLT